MRRYARAVSCTDAARDYLLSQFKASNLSASYIAAYAANTSCATVAGNPVPCINNIQINDQTMSTGHYDDFAVTSVGLATGVNTTQNTGVNDISNRIIKGGLGGQMYRMTVVCNNTAAGSDAGSRQSEVEFLVRFGL